MSDKHLRLVAKERANEPVAAGCRASIGLPLDRGRRGIGRSHARRSRLCLGPSVQRFLNRLVVGVKGRLQQYQRGDAAGHMRYFGHFIERQTAAQQHFLAVGEPLLE